MMIGVFMLALMSSRKICTVVFCSVAFLVGSIPFFYAGVALIIESHSQQPAPPGHYNDATAGMLGCFYLFVSVVSGITVSFASCFLTYAVKKLLKRPFRKDQQEL